MVRLVVVVPTYNEVGNVQTLVAGIAAVAAKETDVDITVVIADDSSPDGTAALVEQFAPKMEAANMHVRWIVKPVKEGLGAAYVNAFGQLADDGYDYFLQMDADLSHDPAYIQRFIVEIRKGTELVVASRYIDGGGTPDWSWDRRFLSHGGNIYSRAMLSRRITDWTGGFNLYSAALLAEITPQTITTTGYGFMLVLKYRALRAAKSIAEIPIVFLDRTKGSSKMPTNTLLQNFVLVLRLRFGRVV